MQAEVIEGSVEFFERPLVSPLVLSSGSITHCTEARTQVTVQVEGRTATGKGSIYLSDLWAWPDPSLDHDLRDRVLRGICENIAGDLGGLCGAAAMHPLELGLRLHENVCDPKALRASTGYDVHPLARSMCASPFDAAIHDAAGLALGISAFDFYQEPVALPIADPYFPDSSACAAIRAGLGRPKSELKAWYLATPNDTVDELRPWIEERGYRCLKVKLLGQDNESDVARTIEVFRMAKDLGAQKPELSVDTNEANPDANSVLDYLQRLKAADSGTYDALQFLEQPTGRDITVHKFDWSQVTKHKPVMLDEGFVQLELMAEAKSQGWSGFALKTCKGHSVALTAAAWARRNGMSISLQDLTNPGYAMIHAALFASRVHTINDVELNSPQFTPAANEAWRDRLRACSIHTTACTSSAQRFQLALDRTCS